MKHHSLLKSKRGRPRRGPNLRKSDRRPAPNQKPQRRNKRQKPQREEVIEDLVPLGGGFYGTAWEEPVDPRDCEKWPNSIQCSGFDAFERGNWAGGEASLILDECNIGINYDPAFLMFRGPSLQLVWRRPQCRLPDVEGGLADIFDDRPLPDPPVEWTLSQTAMTLAVALGPDDKFGGVVDVQIRWNGELKTYPFVRFVREVNGETRETFYNPLRVVNQNNFTIDLIDAHKNNLWGYEVTGLAKNIQTVRLFMFWLGDEIQNPTQVAHSTSGQHFEGWNRVTTKHYGPYTSNGTATLSTPYAEEIQRHQWPLFDYFNPDRYFLIEWTANGEPKRPVTAPPPFPPHLLPTPPMNCCRNPNEDALRLVLKKLKAIEKTLGPFPMKVTNYEKKSRDKPGYRKKIRTIKSLSDGVREIYESTDRINAITDADRMIKEGYKLPKRLIYPLKNGDKSTVKYDSIPGLFEFLIKQLDRSVGTLPQKIKISDGDPTKKGNQKVEIESHSIADMLKNSLEIAVENRGDIDMTNLMLFRALMEIGLVHQLSVKSYAMLDALVEWADFKIEYKTEEVRFVFNPLAGLRKKKGFDPKDKQKADVPDNEKELDKVIVEFLKETTLQIPIVTNVEEGKTQSDFYREILKYAQLSGQAVTEPASGKRLKQLVEAAYQVSKISSAIERSNTRQALTSGMLSLGG